MDTGKAKTVSTIATALGVLGLFNAISVGATYLSDPAKLQAQLTPGAPGQTAQLIEVQAEMTKAMLAITESWRTYNGVMAVLTILVSGALLAGGILGLKLREQGRRILQITFLAAIPVEILGAIATISAGLASRRVILEFMPRMMRASLPAGGSSPPAGMEGMASGLAEGGAVLGLAISVVWILFKLGFFGVGSMYLRRPDVRAAFKA